MSIVSIKPNIFSYATGELAQDAFLCWFLEWSKESNKAHNLELNIISLAFVKKLLEIPDSENFSIDKIRILRQKDNIDILAEVNDQYLILIEDKVKTTFHSGQLQKYADKVAKRYKPPQWVIKKHYVKSYLVWGSERDYVDKEGYQVFDIYDFADFVEPHGTVANDFYQDFRLSILTRRDRYQSYTNLAPDAWYRDTWYGFLHALRKKLGYGKFAAHHSGSPYWLVLTWLRNYGAEGSNVSLEFHTGRLVIKTHIKDSTTDKKKLREDLINNLRPIYDGIGVKFKIVGGKGKRLIGANSMAILELTDYLKFKDDGIDFTETCRAINELNIAFNKLS
ncbi:PD-(D/E)XK nuclease family protein [Leucothrix mucor]|uniref:PD-(D/E)XK nuclease family protein n=1 Tax=Leucothrix mucor TaxID=45248 RepID=UPI000404D55D|nr:PD-(D/E)XK nuclease family protein [Leucothrix mucor]